LILSALYKQIFSKKKIDLKGAKTVEDLKKILVTRKPSSLAEVLSAFDLFLPVIV
jgi:hypothetical protein